ncbi:MAG: caspase family protein [Crocinitomicaceae bacterium]|nr:caspase family protein [Crocinitomicaceae bacterium]
MNTLKMRLLLVFPLFFFGFHGLGQGKDVEVVIATGLEMSQASAFAPNNRYVAQALYNAVSIWDVKTGRMLRNVTYSDNITQVTDSIWFSEDSKKLIVGIAVSNDTYEVDVETGKSEFKKGAPYDFTNYVYNQSIRTSSTLYLYSGSKKDLVYKAPGGNAELVYKVIKNAYSNSNVVANSFEFHIKVGGKLSPPLDTTFHAAFTFSPDGQYVFAESAIYDLLNARRVADLKIVPFSGSSVMFFPETRIPVTAAFENLRIWDFPDVEDVEVSDLVKFKPSENGKIVICEKYNWNGGHKEYIALDLEKKKQIGKSTTTEATGYLLDASSDGTKYTYLEMVKDDPSKMEIRYNIRVCDVATGKVLHNIPNSTKAYFTSKENIMLIDSFGVSNKFYDLKSGKILPFDIAPNMASRSAYQVSSNHKYLLGTEYLAYETNENKSKVYIWDLATGASVFETEVYGLNISAFNISKDESKVSFASSNGHVIYIYDFKTKNKLLKLAGHTAIVQDTYFSDDGTRLISSALDGTRRVWNIEEGHEMVSLVNTGAKDYAIITPKQYYYATKGAKKLIHFVKGLEIYPFAQFDLKYNRPDIILQNMEASNQDLIRPFYYAYQKRLARLGFTEEMLDGAFHMPTASIDNQSGIPISTNNGELVLNVSANDELYNLDRVIVRINEVPVYGKKGISLTDKSSKSYEDEIKVQLSRGRNLVEVSVMNEKGVESIASNVMVYYESDIETKPNLYLYTIGVSEYVQSDYNLTYAAKDASDLAKLFKGGSKSFNSVIVHQFTNEEVNLETIKSIKKELKSTKVDDAICIFFAGHGILDINLDYYLASHDIDFKDPSKRGIPYDVFEDLLDNVPARKKLVMIDACHSGEIDKEEVALVENENKDNQEENITFRSVNSSTVKQIGLNNSFELMKELFNDIRKSSGAVIISSAGGMEYAMEGGQWNNGVFTYSFLHGILDQSADLNEDGVIMLSEMNKFVREEVVRLTNGRQTPTNRAEIIESDWQLW